MMAIDPPATMRSITLHLLCLFIGCANAQAGTPEPVQPLSSRVGVLDARRPEAPRIAIDHPQATDQPQRYLRLSPPAGNKTQCCVQTGAAVSEASLLKYEGDEASPADEREAHFQNPPKEGFVGLLLEKNPAVTRASAHRITIRWPDRKEKLRVDHCLSSEGMHVKIFESATGKTLWKPKAHYYIPLGADVTPDCPP